VDLVVLSFAISALAYFLLLIKVAKSSSLAGPARLVQFSFVTALGSTVLWSVAGLAMRLRPEFAAFAVASDASDLIRYGAWLLMLWFVTRGIERALDIGWAAWLLSGAIFLGLFSFSFAVRIDPERIIGIQNRLLLLAYLALPVAGLLLLEQMYRNVPEDFRWHAKPLCLGLAFIFLFDIYLYSYAVLFGDVDGSSRDARPVVHTFAAPLMLAASNRHGGWTKSLQVSRVAAANTATLTFVGIYLIAVSAIGYYIRVFGGTWGETLQLSLLSVALLALAMVLFSASWRARLRVVIAKNFYSYRYDYRAEWLQFTAMLASSSSPRQTGEMIVRGLAGMVQSPAGALWSKAVGSANFVQTSRWNTGESVEQESSSTKFLARLLRNGWIVDLDEYRETPERYAGWMIPMWLTANERNWLVIPLPVAGELIGFVVLQRTNARLDLSWEVRDILKTASRQAASFLGQISATEALIEARKFDAFNRMSAFVVHDLKNIVAQLSLMMQNARRLHDNPEFRQDMFTTIENSLQKMRQLMLQLRDGATPTGMAIGVELAPILREAQQQAKRRGREIEVEIIDSLLATRGHEERVARVLGHLVQNALDATTESGKVYARLEKVGGQAEITIRDTGHGMAPNFVRTELFKPFSSSKPHGMGIGAYESLQYIEGIGGRIVVDSHVGRGTKMIVYLPLFNAREVGDVDFATNHDTL
jgi:putative PEP-CTERM system histidine kinase